MALKRYAQVGKYCVSCGSCVKVCPKEALSIWKGVMAKVDRKLCVGCGKCASECPAGTLDMREREAAE